MTKSYFKEERVALSYHSWEESIIAPKFTLKNFVDELHYYLRIYIKKKKKFFVIVRYLFLNAIQRIFYTLGSFEVKLKLSNN